MSAAESLVARAIDLAERGRVPDPLIRWGTARLVGVRLDRERRTDPTERERFWAQAAEGPIALVPDLANDQHYEVPAAFFDLVLGPRRKYSSALWPDGVDDLEAAEEAMLALTATRADLADGQDVLDLGCGWGSFTLWTAERFPESAVLGVSNSSGQREHILRLAAERGLDNVEVVTADVNDFDPGDRRFDRVVSVEMLEHVRNHPELFRRLRRWVRDDGAVFVHVFAHRTFAYPFEVDGPASWMAETFFSGGVMPSVDLLPRAAAPDFELDGDWWVDGTHYERTLDAWLVRMDDRIDEVRAVLAPVYGDDLDRWLQRWRMFFMACSALFAYDDGDEWGIAHHRFRPV
ncbi:MAG: cyclopropane-fatty-acyl-phospholipid synthase family protein [Acidimicrobiia bacterium]